MASSSTELESEVTISDVPDDEIPPAVLDAEEEVAMEQCSKQVEVHKIPPPILDAREEGVEVSELLGDIPGIQLQDWRAFSRKRPDGRTDKLYIHKGYLHKFRSIPEVEEFIKCDGIETGRFRKSELRKKKLAGMDVQDSGTSKSAGRRVRPKHSLG